ncbi:MAG: addiction module protein, partial [Bacteroidales bacterium]|nr:addiction module protein [Bacteroidales bacterium]
IIDVKEDSYDIPEEHKMLLDERLKMVEEGKTSFRDWEMVKKKYEGRTI